MNIVRVCSQSRERPLKRFDIFSSPGWNNGLNNLRFIMNREGLGSMWHPPPSKAVETELGKVY